MNHNIKFALRTTTLALLVAGAGLYACQEEKGPLERAGAKIDESVDDAKHAIEAKGPLERAGADIDETVNDAKRAAEDVAD